MRTIALSSLVVVMVTMATTDAKDIVPIPRLDELTLDQIQDLLFSKTYKYVNQVRKARKDADDDMQSVRIRHGSLQTEVNSLGSSMSIISTTYSNWLKSLRQRVNRIEKKLKKHLDGKIRMVAFQAYLEDPTAEESSTPVTYNTENNIIFEHAPMNLPMAYNTTSGQMRAPAQGIYLLAARIKTEHRTGAAGFTILHNGQKVAQAESTGVSQVHDAGLAVAIVMMSPGDLVEVKPAISGPTTVVTGTQSWFMGFLLNKRSERIFFSPRRG